MHANQFATSNREETPAPHKLSREPIDNKFQVVLLLEKFQMLQKNVKSLLEQLKVCIFPEIVFGVRCTLSISLNFVML